jgi:DNA replication protein DnaC
MVPAWCFPVAQIDRGACLDVRRQSAWIDAHENLILYGPTASGRAVSPLLGYKACRDNRSVLYQRIPKLFADLTLARGGCACSQAQCALSEYLLASLDFLQQLLRVFY